MVHSIRYLQCVLTRFSCDSVISQSRLWDMNKDRTCTATIIHSCSSGTCRYEYVLKRLFGVSVGNIHPRKSISMMDVDWLVRPLA